MRIPVVVISGLADADSLRSLEVGAVDHLQKPVTIDRPRMTIDALDPESRTAPGGGFRLRSFLISPLWSVLRASGATRLLQSL